MRPFPDVRASLAAMPAALAAVMALVAMGFASGPVRAQQADHPMLDPMVPRGHIQLGVTPMFSTWNERYGVDAQGGTQVQPLGQDLTDPNGVSPFAGISLLQANLAALTGQSTFTPTLGSLSGVVTKDATRVETSIRLGVFDWLTIGAMVPYVKTRTAIDLAFRADSAGATLGVSPAVTDAGAVGDLVGALNDAASAAQQRADNTCAGGAGTACTSARDLANRTAAFATNVLQSYYATPFFPRDSTAMAGALTAALTALNGDLTAAGLSPVTQPMVFASEVVDEATFQSLLTNSSAGIQSTPLQTFMGLWSLGDMEVTADVRLLDGAIRDSAMSPPHLAWTLTAGALVRLGTGSTNNPDTLLQVGSGDGQTDLEGHVAAALLLGSHVGLRASFRYGRQRATTLVRRVAPPDQIIASALSRRVVKWTPGNYTDLQISPRFLITPALALSLDYRRFHKGADTYALTSSEGQNAYPVDVSVLNRQTEVSLSEASVGLRYNTTALWRQGSSDLPIELGLRLIHAVGGSGGQVPKATRGELTVSIFHRLWGPSSPSPRTATH